MKQLHLIRRVWQRRGFAFRFYTVFLLCFLAEPISYACGWYPEAETYRFSLFNPNLASRRYEPFQFTSYFLYDYENRENRRIADQQNIDEWIRFTKFKGSPRAIDYVLNHVTPEEFAEKAATPASALFVTNPFLTHLQKTKNQEAIRYLQFAKKCEVVNTIANQNPWDESAKAPATEYQSLIAEGEGLYTTCTAAFLKLRYGFQLVRLARYLEDKELTRSFYQKYVEPYPSESIVAYWAMWHYAEVQENKTYQNYLLAKVFEHAHDKKVIAYTFFNHSDVTPAKSLQLAKTAQEKATLLTLYELHNPGRSLNGIRAIAALSPASEVLESLLIREVNKLEDWILTVRYTEFGPAVDYHDKPDDYWQYETTYAQKNYRKDLLYLKEVLAFAETLSAQKTHNPALLYTITAYLAYMDSQFAKCSQYLTKALQSKGLNSRIEAQIHLIRIVAELNPQNAPTPTTDAWLLAELQWLEKNKVAVHQYSKSFYKLMMALTNRYWEAGDIIRATLCHSKVFDFVRFEDSFYSEKDSIDYNFEDTKMNEREAGMNYYSSYLFFLDEKASPRQVEELLTFLDKPSKNALESYLASTLQGHKNRLYDLLGIKYMRENNLTKAHAAFGKVSNAFWLSEKESYKKYLNANPFYTNFYQEHSASKADVVTFTKYSLTDSLIHVLERAENPKEPNRAKWYFLAANCYLNMTYWGNSWIMTRYWHSRNELSDWGDHPYQHYSDNPIYYECNQALQLYLKARQFAKTKRMEAFCTRMAGRCQTYGLLYTHRFEKTVYDYNLSKEVANPRYRPNVYLTQLESQYPDYYDQLMYQCTSFDDYFQELIR